ncbi:hypothetical protein G7046_g4584 [Stylonectria norvegica]|nr:hypothetical protein G7046_g4584 [Stylonectria norvegica]
MEPCPSSQRPPALIQRGRCPRDGSEYQKHREALPGLSEKTETRAKRGARGSDLGRSLLARTWVAGRPRGTPEPAGHGRPKCQGSENKAKRAKRGMESMERGRLRAWIEVPRLQPSSRETRLSPNKPPVDVGAAAPLRYDSRDTPSHRRTLGRTCLGIHMLAWWFVAAAAL